MSIQKILFAIVAPMLLTGALGAGCARSPEDVCSHLDKLTTKEIGEKAARKANEGCVKQWKRAKEMKGYFEYRRISRCVTAASGIKEVSKCK